MTPDARPTDHAAATGGAWRAALVCMLVSLAVRAWVLRDLHAHDPLLAVPVLDDAYYVETAQRMASGDARAWFLAPLHPWLGSVFGGADGPGLRTLSWINAVAGALTSGVCAFAAAELVGERVRRAAAAWAGGLLHALLGAFVFLEVVPGQEPVIGLCVAGIVVLGARLLRAPRRTEALALGVLVGIAAMGRGTSLGLLLCAAPALARHRPQRLGLAALGGLLVALAPASIRNLGVTGSLSPFPATAGVNLFLGNGPDARASVAMTASELGADPWTIEERALAGARVFVDHVPSPGEVSQYWVWRTATSLDASSAGHFARKAVLVLAPDHRGSNHHPGVESTFSTYLGLVPVSGWWLLALAAGCWWWRRRDAPGVDVAGLAAAAVALGLVVFFPVGRYRHPALVAAVIVVGASLPLVRAAWSGNRRRLFAGGALAALVVGVALLPVAPATAANAHATVAVALARQNAEPDEVAWHMSRALALEPDHGPANELAGRRLLAAGQPAEALALLLRAAKDGRTRVSAQAAAIPALLALGRPHDAHQVALGLLGEGYPYSAEVLANAALAYAATGDLDRARELLGDAVALDRNDPAVRAAAARLR